MTDPEHTVLPGVLRWCPPAREVTTRLSLAFLRGVERPAGAEWSGSSGDKPCKEWLPDTGAELWKPVHAVGFSRLTVFTEKSLSEGVSCRQHGILFAFPSVTLSYIFFTKSMKSKKNLLWTKSPGLRTKGRQIQKTKNKIPLLHYLSYSALSTIPPHTHTSCTYFI